MIVGVKRFLKGDDGVFGHLTAAGVDVGYSLEPFDEIVPAGLYELRIGPSMNLHRLMPHIIGIPGRVGVAIGSIGLVQDLRCGIAVGGAMSVEGLRSSDEIFDQLFLNLEDAEYDGEENLIAISDQWEKPVAITVTEDAPQALGGYLAADMDRNSFGRP